MRPHGSFSDRSFYVFYLILFFFFWATEISLNKGFKSYTELGPESKQALAFKSASPFDSRLMKEK